MEKGATGTGVAKCEIVVTMLSKEISHEGCRPDLQKFHPRGQCGEEAPPPTL